MSTFRSLRFSFLSIPVFCLALLITGCDDGVNNGPNADTPTDIMNVSGSWELFFDTVERGTLFGFAQRYVMNVQQSGNTFEGFARDTLIQGDVSGTVSGNVIDFEVMWDNGVRSFYRVTITDYVGTQESGNEGSGTYHYGLGTTSLQGILSMFRREAN